MVVKQDLVKSTSDEIIGYYDIDNKHKVEI